MKVLITFFLLAFVGLTCATPVWPIYSDYYKSLYTGRPHNEKARALFESLTTAQHQSLDDANDNDDDDIADLQAVFNVLEQASKERAAANGNDAMAQLLEGSVWNLAKGYLKNKYCTEEQEVRAMVQELIGKQSEDDDANDSKEGDDKARAELQTLYSALKKIEAKMMQDKSDAKIEGWFKKLRRSLKKKAKQYLC